MNGRTEFISRLEALRDEEDRAALARLRRGLGRRMGCVEMYPYVVPFLPADGRNAEPYFLVAALFGSHPERPRELDETIGAVFARIRDARGSSDSLEGRFSALLAAHEDDLGGHLRHAVSLARAAGIGIDYNRLLLDAIRWGHPERYVQLRWARDFWGSRARAGGAPTDASGEAGDDAPAPTATPAPADGRS